MGIRYNVVRVYPLFCKTKSKTTKIFELRQISSFDLGTPYCIGNSESKNGLKGRVERIFFFASFKLPLFNEYEMVQVVECHEVKTLTGRCVCVIPVSQKNRTLCSCP